MARDTILHLGLEVGDDVLADDLALHLRDARGSNRLKSSTPREAHWLRIYRFPVLASLHAALWYAWRHHYLPHPVIVATLGLIWGMCVIWVAFWRHNFDGASLFLRGANGKPEAEKLLALGADMMRLGELAYAEQIFINVLAVNGVVIPSTGMVVFMAGFEVFSQLFHMVPGFISIVRTIVGGETAMQRLMLVGSAYFNLFHIYYARGEINKAVLTLFRAMNLFEVARNQHQLVLIYKNVHILCSGKAYRTLGWLGPVFRRLAMAPAAPNEDISMYLMTLPAYLESGSWREAASVLARAAEMCESYSLELQNKLTMNVSFLFYLQGRSREAALLSRTLYHRALRNHDYYTARQMFLSTSLHLHAIKCYDECEYILNEVRWPAHVLADLHNPTRVFHRALYAMQYTILASVHVNQGRFAEARQDVKRIIDWEFGFNLYLFPNIHILLDACFALYERSAYEAYVHPPDGDDYTLPFDDTFSESGAGGHTDTESGGDSGSDGEDDNNADGEAPRNSRRPRGVFDGDAAVAHGPLELVLAAAHVVNSVSAVPFDHLVLPPRATDDAPSGPAGSTSTAPAAATTSVAMENMPTPPGTMTPSSRHISGDYSEGGSMNNTPRRHYNAATMGHGSAAAAAAHQARHDATTAATLAAASASLSSREATPGSTPRSTHGVRGRIASLVDMDIDGVRRLAREFSRYHLRDYLPPPKPTPGVGGAVAGSAPSTTGMGMVDVAGPVQTSGEIPGAAPLHAYPPPAPPPALLGALQGGPPRGSAPADGGAGVRPSPAGSAAATGGGSAAPSGPPSSNHSPTAAAGQSTSAAGAHPSLPPLNTAAVTGAGAAGAAGAAAVPSNVASGFPGTPTAHSPAASETSTFSGGAGSTVTQNTAGTNPLHGPGGGTAHGGGGMGGGLRAPAGRVPNPLLERLIQDREHLLIALRRIRGLARSSRIFRPRADVMVGAYFMLPGASRNVARAQGLFENARRQATTLGMNHELNIIEEVIAHCEAPYEMD